MLLMQIYKDTLITFRMTLMAGVGERIADGRIMELLWGRLNQDIMTEVETCVG
jgi:hypothetical protein